MLKIKGKEILSEATNISKHLISKGRMIVITNVCNLNCGGCCQLVGHFSKKQLWFISLEELEKNICVLEKHPSASENLAHQAITIFGGEPTLHPQWEEIVALLKRHAPTIFWINTNGRLGHQRYQKEDNLVWWVDLHPDSQLFVQTMHAAADVIKLPNDMAYWEKAQKDCDLWNKCQCSIYKGKAYFCENAGAIDWLFNEGKNGWEIEEGKHPFDKSKAEIDAQASHCCKRCGWCVPELIPRQLSKDPSYVSPLNQTGNNKKHSLPVLQTGEAVVQRWAKQLSSEAISNPPDIGIYQLSENTIENEQNWDFVTKHKASSSEDALCDGRIRHEWTLILEENYVFPNYAFNALVNWMCKERTKGVKRLYVSIPVYEIAAKNYDANMLEPSRMTTTVIVGFHKDSTEKYDEGIYDRLGHRHMTEGSGRTSLWHDKLTDLVGGVVHLGDL